MATRMKRVSDVFKDAQRYLHTRVASLEQNRTFEAAKKPVKQWLEANGTEDDDGNKTYTFPRNITAVDEKVYSGVMLRKAVGAATMDDKEVRELLLKVGVRKAKNQTALEQRVFRTVEVLDMDEVYVLQQEGLITEEELRGLLHYPKPSYSLWPVEAAEPLEDEND